MSSTPNTLSPSRPSTPNPTLSRGSSSRIHVHPGLNSTPSVSNLRAYGHGNSSTATIIPGLQQVPLSSASSAINVDLHEGILLDNADDAEPEEDDQDALGRVDAPGSDEESKRSLREHLRETLARRPSDTREPSSERARQKRKDTDPVDLSVDIVTKYPPREYFVLTDAGKPVYTSRPETDNEGDLTSTIGIIQALVSVFLDDNDKLRCINAGKTRITFLLRSPLYFVCASSWGEPESVTRSHLEYLHLQILSIVTASQLRRIFERRNNFDLRRLLGGAESFLDSMLVHLQTDIAMATSSLHCLKIDLGLRKRLAECLVPTTKMKELLYIVLIAEGRVVTLIRPKKHSIHPADIHILLNTVRNPSFVNSAASASWLPICLPKFNPSGFVNAYIAFPTREARSPLPPPASSDTDVPSSATGSSHSLTSSPVRTVDLDSGLVLMCVSGGGEFENIRGWCDSLALRMYRDGLLESLAATIRSGDTDYTASELGIPGLRHFIYKARAHVQITYPVFEDPYDDVTEQRRLFTLYQILHDNIHAKSGQEAPLKLQYLKTDKECVMGWITQPFELYITLPPSLPKTAAINAANSVARWVKKEEHRLFLKDAPVL